MQRTQTEQWVLESLTFAKTIAQEVHSAYGYVAEREDLQQVAYEALVRCAMRFDPNRGVSFASYAVKRIRGMLIDHICSLYLAPMIDAEQMPVGRYVLGPMAQEEAGPGEFVDIGRDADTWAALEHSDYLRSLAPLLSEREFAVLRALSEGASQEAIARALGLTAGRVSQILRVVRKKIQQEGGR